MLPVRKLPIVSVPCFFAHLQYANKILFTFMSSKQGVTAFSGKYLNRISLIARKCTKKYFTFTKKNNPSSIRKLVNFLYLCRVCKPKKNMSIISYLKFLIRSTNQHGVHSPFVYNFITRCLYNKQLVKPRELC